ncbi:hypothetical protein BJF82_12185 [Kytococcus sp. CUA-901]|nr:hypothetical protein BJF82_12185 [Kytococcus sp. CUA-901]
MQSNFAGATFTELKPNHPYVLGVADLLAVTTLSVDIPPPAIRRLLSAETAERIASLLQDLGPDLELSTIEAPVVAPLMANLYELIKRELRRHGAETSNAWVTASKICARKRPRLYPVRDSVVVTDLGLTGFYAEDWPVFADILNDATVMEKLQSLVAHANTAEAELGDEALLLKHLDTVLWMRGQRLRRQRRASVAQLVRGHTHPQLPL